jgi:hypothetical protein
MVFEPDLSNTCTWQNKCINSRDAESKFCDSHRCKGTSTKTNKRCKNSIACKFHIKDNPQQVTIVDQLLQESIDSPAPRKSVDQMVKDEVRKNLVKNPENFVRTQTKPASKLVDSYKAYKIIGRTSDGRPRTWFPVNVPASSPLMMLERCRLVFEAEPNLLGILIRKGEDAYIIRKDMFLTDVAGNAVLNNPECVRQETRRTR